MARSYGASVACTTSRAAPVPPGVSPYLRALRPLGNRSWRSTPTERSVTAGRSRFLAARTWHVEGHRDRSARGPGLSEPPGARQAHQAAGGRQREALRLTVERFLGAACPPDQLRPHEVATVVAAACRSGPAAALKVGLRCAQLHLSRWRDELEYAPPFRASRRRSNGRCGRCGQPHPQRDRRPRAARHDGPADA